MYHESIKWLLDCEPRPAQLEALSRSYYGQRVLDTRDDIPFPRPLPHHGRPSVGWGHFMEMRVGKTPTALNEAMLFKKDYGIKKLLILSPNKYKHAWHGEALRFGYDAPVHVFESKDKKTNTSFVNMDEMAVVVNYEALIQQKYLNALLDWADDRTMIVADESVVLKNKDSKTFKAALAISKQCGAIRGLSGLPAPQGPHDFWAQLRFMRFIDGFNFYAFRAKFCKMGGFKGRQILGYLNHEELDQLLSDCCFRALRGDWSDKLDSDYDKLKIDMLPEQKRVYREMEEDFLTFVHGSEITADQVISKRMKMQQISSGFVYDEFGEPIDVTPFDKTPKLQDLIQKLETEVRGKVFVVAHYTHTINNLMEHLSKYNPALGAGNSTMKAHGREIEAEKARFNQDDDCRVFIGQSRAIKYGATLMGTQTNPCLSICYFENNYSLDDRRQTEERPQGHGQQAPLYIWDYYSSKIEREIIDALQRKNNIAEVIMGYYK
jgi:hypothetical protein